MAALLIHFAGYLLINLLMPDWAVEAETGYLAYWYGAFALIDLIALNFCYSKTVRYLLIASCSWSMAIVLEMHFVQDNIQRHDWIAQIALDVSMLATFACLACARISRHLNNKRISAKRAM